jgi:Tol biopolymer transport system component
VLKLCGLSVLLCACLTPVGPATASFPGGDGRILFQRTVKRNVDLYTMSAAGKTRRRLTKVTAEDHWPAWSADGGRIAFTRSSSKSGDAVWVMNAVGKGARRLASNGSDPTWAPDGRRIAFFSGRAGNGDVFVANVTGGQATNLTRSESTEVDPSWSPDGAKIAFTSRNDELGESFHLYVMSVDGADLTRLTSGTNDDFVPNWSPDGTRITFVRESPDGDNIWVVNADGTDAHPITFSGSDFDPTWSPSGSRIAFASYRQTRTGEIYVINADGSGLGRLTRDTVDDRSPDWRPLLTQH